MNKNGQQLAMTTDIVKAQPSVMEVIASIASDPNVNVEVMGKLVDLQIRVNEEEKTKALNEALARLDPLLKPVKKSRSGAKTKGGQTKFYYAPLENIDRMLKPLLRQCGLLLSFSTRSVGDKVFAVGTVQEVTKGGTKEAMLPYAPDINDQLNGPQKVGSGISYSERYLVKMLFNLVEEGEDDNGAFAGAISAEEVGKIERLITELGDRFDGVAFAKYLNSQCGVGDVTLIPSHKFAEVEAALKQKAGKK